MDLGKIRIYKYNDHDYFIKPFNFFFNSFDQFFLKNKDLSSINKSKLGFPK